MKTVELTLAQIGNSRGIRLSADLIRRHGFEQGIVMEDRGHEIVLRPKAGPRKLSWKETYVEMAAAWEDWSDWERATADGLEDTPWEHPIPRSVREWAKESAAKERRRPRKPAGSCGSGATRRE